MSKPLHVLIIEDSDDDAQLIVRELRRNDYEPDYLRVDNAEELKKALDHKKWDVIFSDYSMPQFTGLEALQIYKEKNLDIPFILVSGTIGEEVAVEAMKAGTHDYLMKNRLQRLVPALEREMKEARIRREHQRAEIALRESEDRFRRIFEEGPVGMVILEPDFRIADVNESLCRMLDYTRDELIGRTFMEISHSDDIEMDIQNAKKVFAGEIQNYQIEKRYLSKKHESIWVKLTAAGIQYDSKGKPLRGLGIIENITNQKKADEQIQNQIAHLAALRTIDLAINSSLDLRVTFQILLDQVVDRLKVNASSILLIDSKTQSLNYAAGRGFRTNLMQSYNLRLGEGIAGRIAFDRQAKFIPNLSDGKENFIRKDLFISEGFVSYYGVPLIAKGQRKGVLEIFHRKELNPDQEWINFFEALAGQAAIAIDNATLFDNLQRTNEELELAYDTTLEGWSRALDLRDEDTEGHTLRVTELTLQLAKNLGLESESLLIIRRGALLHDIGKMGIPDKILLKNGPLTDEEWVIMRKHPVYAYELLSPIVYLRPALDIPYCHHEKWDGSGYPRGLKGEDIPLAARIFAVIDVWDALRSDRPYRKAWPEEKVREHLKKGSGSHFDARVLNKFLKMNLMD